MGESNNLKLYRIDIKYVRELHKVCDRVPSVSPQIKKNNRHFIGIILMINSQLYAVPITRHDGDISKREKLKNNEGYTKVLNEEGRFVSGINFINMIPVTEKQLLPMDDYTILDSDTGVEIKRKQDLRYISNYVETKAHSDEIKNKARTLYNKYISGEEFRRRKMCLPFDKLEEVCARYNEKIADREKVN